MVAHKPKSIGLVFVDDVDEKNWLLESHFSAQMCLGEMQISLKVVASDEKTWLPTKLKNCKVHSSDSVTWFICRLARGVIQNQQLT